MESVKISKQKVDAEFVEGLQSFLKGVVKGLEVQWWADLIWEQIWQEGPLAEGFTQEVKS